LIQQLNLEGRMDGRTPHDGESRAMQKPWKNTSRDVQNKFVYFVSDFEKNWDSVQYESRSVQFKKSRFNDDKYLTAF